MSPTTFEQKLDSAIRIAAKIHPLSSIVLELAGLVINGFKKLKIPIGTFEATILKYKTAHAELGDAIADHRALFGEGTTPPPADGGTTTIGG